MSADKLLTAADIESASDMTIERVDVPEWGGHVYVRDMGAKARDEFDEMLYAENGEPIREGFRQKVLLATVCDVSGTLIFTNHHLAILEKKNCIPIRRLYDVAARLNGLRKKDDDAKKPGSESDTEDSSH